MTLNQRALGSNPSRPTNHKKTICLVQMVFFMRLNLPVCISSSNGI
jgi:hypothetical protein